jgi:hypothetical protein
VQRLRPFFIGLCVLVCSAQSGVPSSLAAARLAYNDGRFDDAIVLAEAAMREPATAASAAVVLARARLERYRTGARDPDDLAAARQALTGVDIARLAPREHVEYLIGLGESLYLDEPQEYGAAAEFFEAALARSAVLDVQARDVVFDWWAGSLDRLAQYVPEDERRTVYRRLLDGATAYRDRDDMSAVAWYWLAVSARGVGDLQRAWGGAVAAWIRAGALGERGVKLRADLDRLVTQVLLPERAAQMAPADAASAMPMLEAQWAGVKARWGGRP